MHPPPAEVVTFDPEATVETLIASAEELEGEGGAAEYAAARKENSWLYRQLLDHRKVEAPHGIVSVSCPQPGELTSLESRLRTRNPADGLFDPSLLGTEVARDQYLVDFHLDVDGGGARQASHTKSLRLWAFLAHLVSSDDFLLPPDSDDENDCKADNNNNNNNNPTDSHDANLGAATKSSSSTAPATDVDYSLDGAWDQGAWSGTLLWDAALLASEYIVHNKDWASFISSSDCVLEVGAGLGLPAFVCLTPLGAKRVVATDRAGQVLALLQENASRNGVEVLEGPGEAGFSIETLDWSAHAAWELPNRLGVRSVDVVIACDCILSRLFGASEALAEFLAALAEANPDFRVLLSSEMRPVGGVSAFLRRASENFDISLVQVTRLVHLYDLRVKRPSNA